VLVALSAQMELMQITQLSNVNYVPLNVHHAHQLLHAYLVMQVFISAILHVFHSVQMEQLPLIQLQVVFAKIVLILAVNVRAQQHFVPFVLKQILHYFYLTAPA
jgi:hypothetical protein